MHQQQATLKNKDHFLHITLDQKTMVTKGFLVAKSHKRILLVQAQDIIKRDIVQFVNQLCTAPQERMAISFKKHKAKHPTTLSCTITTSYIKTLFNKRKGSRSSQFH